MPTQNYLFPEDEPPTQQSLFEAQERGEATAPRRRLTKEEIDRVRDVPGFPIATDEAIIALSDPPYYTACPNPFLAEIVAGWRHERAELRASLGLPDDEVDPAVYQREPFAADVSEGKNDPIYNAHSYHTKVPHKAIMRYILHYTDPGDIVFDGFCGTGMTGVAAQLCGDRAAVESLGYRVDEAGVIYDDDTPISRLGARKAVLNDLSPAATFIAYNYNTPVDAAAFEVEARRILAEVEAECGWMYETTHIDGRKGRINYTVWSDVFICPNCGGEIVFWEAAVDQQEGKVRDSFPCAQCSAIQTKRSLGRSYETLYDVRLGETVKTAKQKMVLINYYVAGSRRSFEKTPDEYDIGLQQKIQDYNDASWYPTNKMDKNTDRWSKDAYYLLGISHVHQFYTKRNIWCLGQLWRRSANSSFKWLLTAIMQRASKQHQIAISRIGGEKKDAGGKTAGHRRGTLYIPSNQIEFSVFELLRERLSVAIKAISRQRKHNLIAITAQSSHQLIAPDNSVDYIFVDPPFGVNIMYSELNYLWEAWLGVITNCKSEVVINHQQKKGIGEYQRLMESCFVEFHRIIKSGHWITVEFHNSQSSVWNSIQEAMLQAGFIIADVRTLDKQKKTHTQVTAAGAVNQDLAITGYKPNITFVQTFERIKGTEDGAWAFVREHLAAVPTFVTNKGRVEVIAERMPYLLFDRMVAFHLQRGATVPLSAAQFYAGLKQRFPERDGMHFLETQAAEYDQKRAAVGAVEQFTFYVSDEKSSLQWLRQLLAGEGPQSYQQIQPRFLQELQQSRTELLPELRDLLQQNFLQDDAGRWLVPDPANELHLEQLRRKELLREYETYRQGKGKLKSVRSEAVRAGFEEAYTRGDYAAILAVAARLPEAVLREDPTILTYYDLAQMEEEG